VLALYAKHDYNTLFDGSVPHCGMYPEVGGVPTCDEAGQVRAAHDRQLANGALITGGVGLAIALTGAALWFSAPTEAQLAPTLTTTSVGMMLTRAF